MNLKNKSKKQLYPEVLRIICSFAVVMIHVSGSWWPSTDCFSSSLLFFTFYNSFSRFAVDVFIMISGMFLLNPQKTITLNALYKKYIFRIGIAFAFWSMFYACYRCFVYSKQSFSISSVKWIIKKFFDSEWHLWYLLMLIGLYALIPVFKKITADKKLMKYFILLFFSIEIVLNNICSLPYFNILRPAFNDIKLGCYIYYSGYFVLGYYLHTYGIAHKKHRVLLYSTTIITSLIMLFLSLYVSIENQSANIDFFENFSICTFLVAISVVLFFKEWCAKHKFSERIVQLITKISSYTFGIYLVHYLFIILCSQLNLSPLNWNAAFSIPIISVIIYLFSLIIVSLIKKIPILGKYIV